MSSLRIIFLDTEIDIDTCGDSPCQEYTFIGNPPPPISFSVDETREAFLRFFEEKSH